MDSISNNHWAAPSEKYGGRREIASLHVAISYPPIVHRTPLLSRTESHDVPHHQRRNLPSPARTKASRHSHVTLVSTSHPMYRVLCGENRKINNTVVSTPPTPQSRPGDSTQCSDPIYAWSMMQHYTAKCIPPGPHAHQSCSEMHGNLNLHRHAHARVRNTHTSLEPID